MKMQLQEKSRRTLRTGTVVASLLCLTSEDLPLYPDTPRDALLPIFEFCFFLRSYVETSRLV